MKKAIQFAAMLLAVGAVSMSCLAEEQTSAPAGVPVQTYTLKKLTPKNSIYTGKSEAIQVVTIGFENSGKIESTKHIGDVVFGPLKDTAGNVLRPGTVVASQYKTTMQNALKLAENDYTTNKSAFDIQDKVYTQTRKVSKKDYEASKQKYLESKYKLEKAIYNLAATDIVAPFTGIITDVKAGEGMIGGGSVVEITRMDVMLVKIPFNSEIIENMDSSYPVIVYPAGDLPGVPAWIEKGRDNPNMLYALVYNSLVHSKMTPEEQKMKKVYAVTPISGLPLTGFNEFNTEGKTLMELKQTLQFVDCIPTACLHKDDKGTYVLQAVDQTAFSTTKGISKSFKVKKVYVTKGDVETYFNLGSRGGVMLTTLADSGTLKKNDIAIYAGDQGIQDGDTVVMDSVHWTFYPNTELEIGIPGLATPGLYLPEKAILQQGPCDAFAYVVQDGKAKIASIMLTGRESAQGYYRIESSSDYIPSYKNYVKIKEGMNVIVPDDKNVNLLYDGCPVSVSGTYPADIGRIENEIIETLAPLKKVLENVGATE